MSTSKELTWLYEIEECIQTHLDAIARVLSEDMCKKNIGEFKGYAWAMEIAVKIDPESTRTVYTAHATHRETGQLLSGTSATYSGALVELKTAIDCSVLRNTSMHY